MGPAPGSSSSDLPSRPRFSWDLKQAPWTDGKGDQSQYARSVKLWEAFHNELPANNSNKIAVNLRGIRLLSQLYGRAKSLCQNITNNVLKSDAGVKAIVDATYKRDAFAVVSEVYADFLDLLSTKRNSNESFRYFEQRFEAQVAKFNCHSSKEPMLPDSLIAFVLMANANIDGNQRVSIHAAASPKNTSLNSSSTTSEFLKSLTYEAVSSVIRQCDKPKDVKDTSSHSGIQASSVRTHGAWKSSGKRTLTKEQLADLKSKSKCHKCHKKGHWANYPECPENKSSAPTSHNSSSIDPQKTVSFHTAQLSGHDECSMQCIGPLLDDGAPYSGMGIEEFKLIQPHVLPNWNGMFEPLPDVIKDRPYWQYGSGSHCSSSRKIIGSITLLVLSDNNVIVNIRHLLISGSSQWVVGRNVTSLCNIIHMNDNALEFTTPDGTNDFISLIDQDFHCFIPYERFMSESTVPNLSTSCVFFCATAQVSKSLSDLSWPKRKSIVDKVHQHVCGHSSFTDIKTLLERNNIWNADVHKYLSSVIEICANCQKTCLPQPARKVSLSSMSRVFNDVVCVDHLFLDEVPVFHATDSVTRYSVGCVVPDTKISHAVKAFDSLWISQFWNPVKVLFDPAFNVDEFKNFLTQYDTQFQTLPPRRHNKNVIESKHRILRDIYLRLKNANPDQDNHILVQHVFRVSNVLYGNNKLSAYELAKGHTYPVDSSVQPFKIPEDILKAQKCLQAKRKLTLVLNSKSVQDKSVQVGDMVEVFVKHGKEKRGKWTEALPVLSFDFENRSVCLPGKKRKPSALLSKMFVLLLMIIPLLSPYKNRLIL